MSQWYYAQDSQQLGPINEAELKENFATGKLPATVLVWKDGMENWAVANTLPEFQFRPPPAPSAPRMAPIPFATAPAPAPFVPPTAAAPVAAAPVAASAPTPSPAPTETAPGETPATPVMDPEDVNQNKALALIGYLGILFLIPMLAAKDSPFAKYHANQGLILFIGMLILWVAFGIIGQIPFVGLITLVLWPLSSAVWLVFAVIGILNAAKGECKPLPYIGHYNLLS